jgi:broad specificity phosphatase PhoE
MLRAAETAGALAQVPATFMPLFREIPQAPLFDTRVKLPLVVWHVLSRIGWWFNHRSQPEGRRASLQRVARIVDFLRRQPADQEVLIVTHGFLMYVLRGELQRRGFAGRIPLHPQCGEVYFFKRPAEGTIQAPSAAAAQPTLAISSWPGAVRQ